MSSGKQWTVNLQGVASYPAADDIIEPLVSQPAIQDVAQHHIHSPYCHG